MYVGGDSGPPPVLKLAEILDLRQYSVFGHRRGLCDVFKSGALWIELSRELRGDVTESMFIGCRRGEAREGMPDVEVGVRDGCGRGVAGRGTWIVNSVGVDICSFKSRM